MARTETGSRDRMLEAAIDLMRGSGLTGAGINEIVRASAAPKGSVYHYFPEGKSQLAAEALQVYAQRVGAFFDAHLASGKTPRSKVRKLFQAMATRVEEGEFIVVPHGVEHMPVAPEEAHVLLLEPKTTLNTGNVTSERTVPKLDRI